MEIVHQRDGDIAAEHREGAVREVDEIHQPERHRQPDRQHEQQHAVSEAVEQDTENGRGAWRFKAFYSQRGRNTP